jgi:hypothetical protein
MLSRRTGVESPGRTRGDRVYQQILADHGEFEEVGTIVDAGVYEDLGNEVL